MRDKALIEKTISIEITPEDVADFFCSMNGEDQASFFNRVAEVVSGWEGSGWCGQALSIASCPGLTSDAMDVVVKLYDHVYYERQRA